MIRHTHEGRSEQQLKGQPKEVLGHYKEQRLRSHWSFFFWKKARTVSSRVTARAKRTFLTISLSEFMTLVHSQTRARHQDKLERSPVIFLHFTEVWNVGKITSNLNVIVKRHFRSLLKPGMKHRMERIKDWNGMEWNKGWNGTSFVIWNGMRTGMEWNRCGLVCRVCLCHFLCILKIQDARNFI